MDSEVDRIVVLGMKGFRENTTSFISKKNGLQRAVRRAENLKWKWVAMGFEKVKKQSRMGM